MTDKLQQILQLIQGNLGVKPDEFFEAALKRILVEVKND